MNSILQKPPEEAPFYIRWSPDRSLYAIELKLDLVPRICTELIAAEKLGIEVGGVLIGCFPSAHPPTLRIEDFEVIPRRAEDGAVYLLDPDQHERLAQVRWTAKTAGLAAVGFFRSHARPGPLKPSLADRGLLAGQFSQATYAVLLIQAREPHTSAFFIATNGQVPEEPSVKEFRFDEKAFKALPEIQQDAFAGEPPSGRRAAAKYVLTGILLLVLLMTGIFFRPHSSGRQTPSNPIALAVAASDNLLKVSWNHSARQITVATDATLIITDGMSHREIKLGPDELKRGTVDYEPSTRQVLMTMTLNTPGSSSPSQSIEWLGK